MTTLGNRRSDVTPILIAVGIFAALSTLCSRTSEGFLEADACAHYLYARFAFDFPHYFVNIWGRPICTAVYAIPAALGGRAAVHVMSLLLAMGSGLVAWRVAVGQNYRWPALALVFTLAQPLVFLHSFSELTELPFALLLILAFWMYQKRQWLAMTILIALTPLSRPEGFGFLCLAALALMFHRRWWWLLILPIPLVLWNYSGWYLYGQEGPSWKWFIKEWAWSQNSLYPSGSLLHFVLLLPAVTSSFIFPAMCLGIWRSVRDRRQVNQILIAAIPLMILVGHSVLYATGKLASSGEIRYMLIVAPFWALLSASGWEWLATRFNWRAPQLWAGVAALLPITFDAYYKVVPLVLDDDWKRAQRAVTWYRESGIAQAFPRIATAHQAIFYFMDIATTDGRHVVEWRQATLATPTPGTVVLWDPIYSIYNSDQLRKVPVEDLITAGWIDVTERVPTLGKGWRVLLSPTDARGAAADVPEAPSSPSSP